MAAKLGNLEIAKILIRRGADVNQLSVGDNGVLKISPLHIAIENEHLEIVKILTERVKSGECDLALEIAASKENMEIVKVLIESGRVKSKYVLAALQIAVSKRNLEIVKVLIETGKIKSDQLAKEDNGYSPLHIAAAYGYLEIFQYLIEHGADARQTLEDGLYAYELSLQNEHVELQTYMREHGFDISLENV